MARTFIIGDVHGCLAELRMLWDEMRPTRDDHVVFVGDVVDKGPDPRGVVEFIRTKEAEGFRITALLGNHEEKHVRFHKHQKLFEEQGKPIPKGFTGKDQVTKLFQDLSFEDREWMAAMPLWVELPEHNALVVHAGIPTNVDFLPPLEEIKTWSNNKQNKYKTVLRTRFLTPEGKSRHTGDERPGDVFWAETYDGRLGHVFFGHNPFKQPTPMEFDHATGIDMGAVFGGWLTAVVLEKGRTPRSISVQALEEYSTSYWETEL